MSPQTEQIQHLVDNVSLVRAADAEAELQMGSGLHALADGQLVAVFVHLMDVGGEVAECLRVGAATFAVHQHVAGDAGFAVLDVYFPFL